MKTTPWHQVRNSIIHGKGVFANRDIPKGTQVIEYTGKIISRKKADSIEAESENGHTHTMLFSIDDKRVIDGRKGGDARFINHSCDPNCEAVQYDDKIYIEAKRNIKEGDELTYDYHLDVPGKIDKDTLREYVCLCGNENCRGVQISKKNLKKALERKGGKKLKKALKELRKERKEAFKKKEEKSKPSESKKDVKIPLLLKDPEEFLFVKKTNDTKSVDAKSKRSDKDKSKDKKKVEDKKKSDSKKTDKKEKVEEKDKLKAEGKKDKKKEKTEKGKTEVSDSTPLKNEPATKVQQVAARKASSTKSVKSTSTPKKAVKSKAPSKKTPSKNTPAKKVTTKKVTAKKVTAKKPIAKKASTSTKWSTKAAPRKAVKSAKRPSKAAPKKIGRPKLS